MTTEVSSLTEKQLDSLEDKVRRGSAAFVEVGQALARIREGKGYLLRGFKTWEEYCDKTFGISDRHGRRLIQSAEIAATVKRLAGYAPATEAVAREFAPLVAQPDKLKKVVEQIEKRGVATAEAVKDATQKIAPKLHPAVHTGVADTTGVTAAKRPSPAPVQPGPSDGVCPRCGEIPDRYERSDEVWTCSDCGGVVMLSVRVWPPATAGAKPSAPKRKNGGDGVSRCPTCKKPINPGDVFCGNCGTNL